ncbi:MAG: DUF1501 domain-containing protein [Kofleriaceae bacterium]
MKRRTFLAAAGGAGAAVLVGPWIRRSRAAPFGTFPAGTESVQLPAGQQARRVLEIFLYGGISMWETLYFVRDYGRATDPQHPNTQYYAYEAENAAALGRCGHADLERAIGRDANGATVELGPFAARLWSRPDLVERMRIVVQRHALEPHEAAVPMALTGRPVGQPNAAGLGAHIQRARLDSGMTPGRASPHAYVLATGGISTDNVAAAASAGTHMGAARPLMIKTDQASAFTSLLARSSVGSHRASHDALVRAYVDQYQGRLTWPSRGRVRSPRTDDLAVAFHNATQVDAIRGVVSDDLFAERDGAACGMSGLSIPLMGLEAARHLLTHPTEPASYVCVSDIGLFEASGGGGYDTHTDNAADTAMNFDNLLSGLIGIINAPGEGDPRKLDLDDTLIILNTEFGRTPWRQGGSGRNHHPYGYATAFLGGPITAAHRGVSGAIGRDGEAASFGTPSENRMAALLAMGIWPFAADSFNVSDAPTATTELAAAQRAFDKFLGRAS